MPIARKKHICTLCHRPILKGTRYIYETIKPWSHPDNESYSVYKAHLRCHKLWLDVGDGVDWIFPADNYEWDQLTGELK